MFILKMTNPVVVVRNLLILVKITIFKNKIIIKMSKMRNSFKIPQKSKKKAKINKNN